MILSNRKAEPAHYQLKIESFSILCEDPTIKIQSDVFEAIGHKWTLDLYPSGNQAKKADNHISLYLKISDTGSLPKGWKVDVDVKFFIYDHIGLHYVSFENDDGNRTKFHENQMKWGFDKLISLEQFNESSKGYLFNDSCVFGAEVFKVPDYTIKDRCLTMIKPPQTMNTYTWTIEKFSTINQKKIISEVFKVGKVMWTLSIYPRGCKAGAGTDLSMYLKVHEDALFPDSWRIYAKHELRVINQCGYADKVLDDSWGSLRFMELSELGDITKGFLLNDRLIVEAKISVIGMLRNYI